MVLILVLLIINNSILFIIIICCFQLEPNTDRCRPLTVPEEWKIVDSILKQAEEQTQKTGSYTSHKGSR